MGFLPDKPLTRTVLKISTPAVAGLSSQMVVSVVDTAMVGRLENTTVVLAAMGLGMLATWAITSVFSSLSTGTHVLVARRTGGGDFAGAGDVLNNSLFLALVLGLAFGAPGFLFSYNIIDFFSSDPAVALAGTGYMQWRFVGLLFFLFVVAYRGFYNGIGDTHIFMFSAIIINLSNIVLDYVLIFGGFGTPRMGLSGAGASNAIANIIGCIFFLTATFLRRYRTKYRYYNGLRIRNGVIRQLLKISTPVSLQNILILLGFLVFVSITGVIGTSEQAASQVVITALFMSFLPCFGFGVGAQTLVGQSLGNGKPQLAKRYGLEAARLATYFTIALGMVFLLLPDLVIILITNNREVTEIARPILRIAGAAQIFYASGIVLANGLQAAGATVFVMEIEVLTHWVIFLPVCYLLGVRLGYGLPGAWFALPIYIISYTLLIYRKYRSDSWLHAKM
ncbi:MAG TPA: MATE family efflux transporter [Bacteroidota bacterium]|nr:MATE family efflux transporter [Bacteroidota bacterium]